MHGRLLAWSIGILGATLLLWLAAGCTPEREFSVKSEPRGTAALLFDASPGFPNGTDIARSEWPSTPGPYDGPEVSFYREYLYDYQSSYPGGFNYYNRRFLNIRVGTRYR
ncbi:MAG: hypothetical protein L6Q92_12940 [Phycisphaerae bacterium]|nr:hypothetical protein [Phycisphaerae bacterium]